MENQITDAHAPAPIAARILLWLDRRRWLAFGVIGVLLATAYNGQWRVNPDSALYAELGRNLAGGLGFTYHGEPHNWVEPGLPYSIGFSFRHFGVDNFHPLMLAMLGCALLALGLTYALFNLHAGRPVAVLVTSLLGLSETFFRYGYHLFTDMPFLVLVLTFLVGYELIVRGRRPYLAWPLIVFAIVMMVLVRPAVITFIGAVGLACAWHVVRGPGRVRHVVLGLVVVASFVGVKQVDPRKTAAPAGETKRDEMLKSLLGERLGFAVKRTLTRHVPMILEETTLEAIFGMQLGPGVSSVFSLGVFGAGLLLARRRVLWAAWVAATAAQMAIWLPRERYFLPILPLLVFGLWDLAVLIANRWPKVRAAPAVIVGLLVVPNLAYIAKFIIEQRRTPFLAHHDDGDTLKLRAMADALHAAVSPDATVLADRGRELSYFSRRRVTAPITAQRLPPTDAELERERQCLADLGELYAVLPGRNVEATISRLGGTLGEAVVSAGEMTLYHVRFTAPRATTRP
jgi:hypothetical protein